MKKTTISLIAVMASLTLCCAAFAQEVNEFDESRGIQQTYQKESQIPSAAELRGMKVVNRDGEEIGEIAEVNTDLDTGRANYVTLSVNDLPDIDKNQVAAPVEAFSFDKVQQRAQLTVDQSKLKNVPEQTNMDDQAFKRELESHYGVSPAWEDQQEEDAPKW
ncbi:MAG: PRC-barrel domain-containing protein [Desulfurivibrionaceae bacterium]